MIIADLAGDIAGIITLLAFIGFCLLFALSGGR